MLHGDVDVVVVVLHDVVLVVVESACTGKRTQECPATNGWKSGRQPWTASTTVGAGVVAEPPGRTGQLRYQVGTGVGIMMVGKSKEDGSGDECSCFPHYLRLYVEVSTQANRGRALEPDGDGSTRAS